MATPYFRLPVRNSGLITALLLAALAPAGGTPVNDAFASAVLLAGTPASAAGDNSGATLEPGEWNPGNYGGASVWYRWNAPSAGWVEVTTYSEDPDHDLDTVITLLAAGATGTPSESGALGFNDDNRTFTSAHSRLVFLASTGADYRIGIHGYRGETGAFKVAVRSVPPPAWLISSLEISPSEVDVGAGAATATVTVTTQSAPPFPHGALSLFTPDGQSLGEVGLNEVFSSPSGASYEGVLNIGGYRAPGLYPLRILLTADSMTIEWSPTGPDRTEDHYLLPTGGRLPVLNTGLIDAMAPTLVSLSGLPPLVDLSTGDVVLPLTARITDNLSGLARADILLSSEITSFGIGSFSQETLFSGDPLDGIHEMDIEFEGSLPHGTYAVTIRLQDALGNRSTIGGPGGLPLPDGVPASITVTGSRPTNDDFAKRMVLAADELPVASGTTVLATYEPGEPAPSGGPAGSVWYEWTAPSTGWTRIEVSDSCRLGLFTGSDVAALAEEGRNVGGQLVFLAMEGTAYQIAIYSPASFGGTSFELRLAHPEPPPTLRVMQVSLTPGQVDVGGGPMSVFVELTIESDLPFLEPTSGTSWLAASLGPDPAGPNLPIAFVGFESADRISGTATNGRYRQELTLPPFVVESD
jgi:hypothetical protein